MIEELKPCLEMVEKVAEIMYSQPWHRSVTPFAEMDARTQEHFRELARHTLTAITAYDPDKRLRDALEAISSLAICYGMRADEAELRDWLKFISETADAALSHNGG